MNIENEIFKKSTVIFDKLEPYGFIKENDTYKYSKEFMDNTFKASITITLEKKISGKVYDLLADSEYTNIRIENNVGRFVNTVKEEYKKILIDIKNNCFRNEYFLFSQSNRIAEYILNKYKDEPEFLWDKLTGSGVFRNKNNNKWYGLIMNLDRSKLENKTGEIEILNVKANSDVIDSLTKKKGFFKGYHMNKKNWLTIVLDDTIKDEEIIKLIDESYNLINSPEEWIVPANPKYFDIIEHFNNSDEVNWKQSSDVHVNDTVYIYVGAPYSSILFKCIAEEVNIPYEYKDDNLSIKNSMKLRLVKKYKQGELSFAKLNELGIKSIRGPRKISSDISSSF